jgi:hypothetical protein
MLKRLERLVKKYGITKVAHDLGYRSSTTIRNWLTIGKIPAVAKVKVKTYLDNEKGN